MVRIRVPAVAAAAVLALSACSSIDGVFPSPGQPGATFDHALFPPPPPMPTGPMDPPAAPIAGPVAGGFDVGQALAELHGALARLSADIEQSRRHLADLQAEVERTQARIDRLLATDGAGTHGPGRNVVPAPTASGERRPLVRIRYDTPEADYADAVREAVWAALARLPDAAFDLIAVTPAEDDAEPLGAAGEAARLHAEAVMAMLLDLGVEPDRLSLTSAINDTASVDEVHLYIR